MIGILLIFGGFLGVLCAYYLSFAMNVVLTIIALIFLAVTYDMAQNIKSESIDLFGAILFVLFVGFLVSLWVSMGIVDWSSAASDFHDFVFRKR